MNIILIGYRGTGKTTVARSLASRLGWQWVDADACLEDRAGRSIREIFASEGEAGFRDREASVITDLTTRDRHVIAAGGGAIVREDNRQAIRRSGFTVWLVASAATIAERIAADPLTASRRPPLIHGDPATEIRELLERREPLYRACADYVVDSERQSPDEIAQEIEAAFARQPGLTE